MKRCIASNCKYIKNGKCIDYEREKECTEDIGFGNNRILYKLKENK